jgi:hypothetical protein
MRIRKILFVVMILFLIPLASCTPQMSLLPWYNDKDLVLEPGFAGNWLSVDDKGKTEEGGEWTFAQDIKQGYTISLLDDSQPDVKCSWEVRLFRVNGQLFVDAVQQQTKYKDSEVLELFIPGHMVGTAKLAGDSLSLRFLDDEWTDKALKANPALIKHEMVDMDDAVLVASTADLREFALTHYSDSKAFAVKFDFVRKK